MLNFCGFCSNLLSLHRGEILRFNYMHHRSRNFTQGGECERREGEKAENEILLFFNLKKQIWQRTGKRSSGSA